MNDSNGDEEDDEEYWKYSVRKVNNIFAEERVKEKVNINFYKNILLNLILIFNFSR